MSNNKTNTTTVNVTANTATATSGGGVIKELTPEQTAKFPFYVHKWVTIGNSVVTPGFYTDKVVSDITDAIMLLYADNNTPLADRSKVILSPSPVMSPFIAAAHDIGKVGTPKKRVKCKLDHMTAVENFVNGFTNPMEIVKKSGSYLDDRMWGSLDAGFRAYVDFFQNETELGTNGVLAPFERSIEVFREILTPLTYDILFMDTFCVVSKKPVFQTFEQSPEGYPVAKQGEIRWEDGTIVKY